MPALDVRRDKDQCRLGRWRLYEAACTDICTGGWQCCVKVWAVTGRSKVVQQWVECMNGHVNRWLVVQHEVVG
jgi:hypothetical protein